MDPFLAYDVRGRVGEDLNEPLAYRIGMSFSHLFEPESVVLGMDVRESSRDLFKALSDGLMDGGSNVIDIGMCGTEVVYFATSHLGAGGGIMITASHNPRDYNGMKFVGKGSIPIHGLNGLNDIRDMSLQDKDIPRAGRGGGLMSADVVEPYIDKVVSFLEDPDRLGGMKLATDPGHGCAGPFIDKIASRLGIELVRIHHDPDGSFPAGVPNPILPEMRREISQAVISSGADAGAAWDGDFDRCFLFDENGRFIEGYYIVGMLAKTVLEREKGAKIVHDPRLVWNTVEIVRSMGGVPMMNRTGHAFIKDRMRKEDAAYGGEMSAHHYFRDFYYCDTGMVPLMLVLQLISGSEKGLSSLVRDMENRYPVSGEINRKAMDPRQTIEAIEREYAPGALSIDRTDGISIEHERFRFNLRSSNTEPLIRLNVETKGDRALLRSVTEGLLNAIDSIEKESEGSCR
ncbi:MAG: phosphomannomutase [Candidatus Thermoplasmatota archaeon]|nr:phosphomannomutase [Candidatus Thermoplasmatota archaeon]